MDASKWYGCFDHWWVKFLLTRRVTVLPWAFGRRFCLKSMSPPIVMEEDMLWFATNYQLLPYPTCPNRFNSRFTKCHSAIVPCGSFLHCIRCDASHKTVKWRKPRRLKWTCHAMAPQTSEEHISKTLGLLGLKVEIRWVGGTPKDMLTFHRRKPPEWVDTHHKDSQISKKVSQYHDFQTLDFFVWGFHP